MKMTQQMSIGDFIRHMNDAQLANVLLDTITANADYCEEYRIDLGGYISFNVVDEVPIKWDLKYYKKGYIWIWQVAILIVQRMARMMSFIHSSQMYQRS